MRSRERRAAGGGIPLSVCLSAGMHEGRMAAGTGESGNEPATVLDNNSTGIATTAPLTESSTSSSSSSSATATVPTILTESTATGAGNLPLTGSQQQQGLHQVHQQQPRPRVNLITDVAANDVAGNLNDSVAYARGFCCCSCAACQTAFFSLSLSPPSTSPLLSPSLTPLSFSFLGCFILFSLSFSLFSVYRSASLFLSTTFPLRLSSSFLDSSALYRTRSSLRPLLR